MESWYYQYRLPAPLEDNNTILEAKKKQRNVYFPISFNSSDDVTPNSFVKPMPFWNKPILTFFEKNRYKPVVLFQSASLQTN